MDVLRIGILGTARIAEKALIDPAVQVPEVTVAAVASRDLARAQAYGLQHGIPGAYGSYDEMLADTAIDAVYIPLPNSLHGPWTVQAITAGKHVLCEKPFAANATEAALVAEAAAASGLVVMEAMHYRYHPLIRHLREVVRTLGPLQHIQCWTSFVIGDPDDVRYDFALAGGALMDGGCYAIDCLRLLGDGLPGGGEPAVAAALADTARDSAVDRAMAVRMEYPGGATAWFESAFTSTGEFRADVHVTCEEGTAWVRNFIQAHEGTLEVTQAGSATAGDDTEPDAGGHAVLDGDTTYVWQLRAFAAAIETGAAVMTSAAHAIPTMRLIDDAYRAAGLPTR
jgi:predicted dehydrogenase